MNKEAYYFSHDSNARNDERLLAVRMKHGWEGYGLFWAIIEKLRDSSDYVLIKDYNLLAFDLRVSSDKIKSIIEEFGLFEFTENGKGFYSESLLLRMKKREDIVEKRREAGRKGGLKKSKASAKQILSKTEARKGKERKGNNTLSNTRVPADEPQKIDPPETVEKVIQIGAMKAIPAKACEVYWDLRLTDNFLRMDKNGQWKPILNWHADLAHLYKKGALDIKQPKSKNGYHGNSSRKTKGDRAVEFLQRP